MADSIYSAVNNSIAEFNRSSDTYLNLSSTIVRREKTNVSIYKVGDSVSIDDIKSRIYRLVDAQMSNVSTRIIELKIIAMPIASHQFQETSLESCKEYYVAKNNEDPILLEYVTGTNYSSRTFYFKSTETYKVIALQESEIQTVEEVMVEEVTAEENSEIPQMIPNGLRFLGKVKSPENTKNTPKEQLLKETKLD